MAAGEAPLPTPSTAEVIKRLHEVTLIGTADEKARSALRVGQELFCFQQGWVFDVALVQGGIRDLHLLAGVDGPRTRDAAPEAARALVRRLIERASAPERVADGTHQVLCSPAAAFNGAPFAAAFARSQTQDAHQAVVVILQRQPSDPHPGDTECEWTALLAEWLRAECSRARCREALDRERLRRSAIAFDAARDGIMITDEKQEILAVNRAFTEITGYSEEEVRGRNPRLFKSGRHDDSFYEAMWTAIEANGSWSGELWNRQRDGTLYPIRTTIRKVQDPMGCGEACTRYVAFFSDNSEVKNYEQQLELLMHRDPLTELPNRFLFQDRLEQALASGQRANHNTVAAVLDISEFRTVNDSYGRETGDQVLVEIGHRLTDALWDDDTVARIGADRFAVVRPKVGGVEEAASLAERIISVIEEPMLLHDREILLTARVGVSVREPGDRVTPSAMLEQADAATSRAKQEQLSYTFYSEGLTEYARERMELTAELRRALAGDELDLHYQPQFDAEGQLCVGWEALVRWPHPTQGWIPPGRFIPVAERGRLIRQLGQWVLERACRDARNWVQKGLQTGRLAVNVSAAQLEDPGWVDSVFETLSRQQISPRCLELEVTESQLASSDGAVIERLNRLRRAGVAISIDDFGTGYSSFGYLRDLPVDRLKVDRSFIQQLDRDAATVAIVEALLVLGRRLGVEVVAEGVETDNQLQILRRLDRRVVVQGFLFSYPLPLAHAMEQWGGEGATSLRETAPRPK